jgi:hypothetical protein
LPERIDPTDRGQTTGGEPDGGAQDAPLAEGAFVLTGEGGCEMTDENTIIAAILGELVPELGYAAPLLLERLDSGDPLIQATSSTDLGFAGGNVDPVLLEFFNALLPFVKTALSWGLFGILQSWLLHRSSSRAQAELFERLIAGIDANPDLRRVIQVIADLLTRLDKAPVSVNDVVESFAAATRRVSTTDDTRPQ